jgi:hypothetical protein
MKARALALMITALWLLPTNCTEPPEEEDNSTFLLNLLKSQGSQMKFIGSWKCPTAGFCQNNYGYEESSLPSSPCGGNSSSSKCSCSNMVGYCRAEFVDQIYYQSSYWTVSDARETCSILGGTFYTSGCP